MDTPGEIAVPTAEGADSTGQNQEIIENNGSEHDDNEPENYIDSESGKVDEGSESDDDESDEFDEDENLQMKARTQKRFNKMRNQYKELQNEIKSLKEQINAHPEVKNQDDPRAVVKDILMNEKKNQEIIDALTEVGLQTPGQRKKFGKGIAPDAEALARIHGVSFKEGVKLAYSLRTKNRNLTPSEEREIKSMTPAGSQQTSVGGKKAVAPWVKQLATQFGNVSPKTLENYSKKNN